MTPNTQKQIDALKRAEWEKERAFRDFLRHANAEATRWDLPKTEHEKNEVRDEKQNS